MEEFIVRSGVPYKLDPKRPGIYWLWPMSLVPSEIREQVRREFYQRYPWVKNRG